MASKTCRFIQVESDTGDKCHHNLIGLSELEARDLFKQAQLDQFQICTETNDHRPLTQIDVDTWV